MKVNIHGTISDTVDEIYSQISKIMEELKKLTEQYDSVESLYLRDSLSKMIRLTSTIIYTTNESLICINQIGLNYNSSETQILEMAKKKSDSQKNNLINYVQTDKEIIDKEFISVMLKQIQGDIDTAKIQYDRLQEFHNLKLLSLIKTLQLNIVCTLFVLEINDFGKEKEKREAYETIVNTAVGLVSYISHIVNLYNLITTFNKLLKTYDKDKMRSQFFQNSNEIMKIAEEQILILIEISNQQTKIYEEAKKALYDSAKV